MQKTHRAVLLQTYVLSTYKYISSWHDVFTKKKENIPLSVGFQNLFLIKKYIHVGWLISLL